MLRHSQDLRGENEAVTNSENALLGSLFYGRKKQPLFPRPRCRYCQKRIWFKAVKARSYWEKGTRQLSHARCLVTGFERECIECQKLDADCNDCRYFKAERNRKHIRYGICMRPKRPEGFRDSIHAGWPHVIARPGSATLMPCFHHRKDELK